jgi:uncharacterized protein with GYD domain
MAIFITQARFTKDGSTGTTAAPEDRTEAVARLVAAVEGKLIARYLTSGHYDILLIFEGPSHEKLEPALAAAAAGSGLADLKTVRMLANSEMTSEAQEEAQENTRESASESATEDAKTAAAILQAQQQTVENIQAGRPAPYFIAPLLAPAQSQATPAPPSTKRKGASKKSKSLQSHEEQDDGKSV